MPGRLAPRGQEQAAHPALVSGLGVLDLPGRIDDLLGEGSVDFDPVLEIQNVELGRVEGGQLLLRVPLSLGLQGDRHLLLGDDLVLVAVAKVHVAADEIQVLLEILLLVVGREAHVFLVLLGQLILDEVPALDVSLGVELSADELLGVEVGEVGPELVEAGEGPVAVLADEEEELALEDGVAVDAGLAPHDDGGEV